MNLNEINPFSKVDKYLNHAVETEKKASTNATAAATLVIDALKEMSAKLNEMPSSEGKEQTLKDIHQKIESLETFNHALKQSKKVLHSLDLVEKIYQKVKEIKGSLIIENKDIILKLENQWNHLKNDHTKLTKYFAKAKMHFLDSTMRILSDVQGNKESLQDFFTQFPKEKIQDFSSLKNALKINSFYKSVKSPEISQKPVKVYQENIANEQAVEESPAKEPIKPAIPPKKVLPFHTLPVPDNKLFLHQHGDFFGKGSGLEGGNTGHILNYGLAFISALKKNQFEVLDEKTNQSSLTSIFNAIESQIKTAITINALFEGLHTYSDLKSKSQELRNLVEKSLESTGTVLIPGGWAGVPFGHDMLYEVKLNSNGTYNFRVFNRGAGNSYHDNFVKAPHKLLFAPFMEYENITKENLFNPVFLRGLLEFQIKGNNPSEYDIYEGLLPLLKGKQKKLNLEMEDLMSLQHSGTCTWKSFCAYLRGQLSYNQYKKFMFCVKQQGLWDYYQENHLLIASDPHKKNLFEKGLQGFSRSLEKINKGGLISPEEYEDSIRGLMQIKENILLQTIEHLKKLHQNAPIADCSLVPINAKWSLSFDSSVENIDTKITSKPSSISIELTNLVKNWKPVAKAVASDFLLMRKQLNQAKLDGKYEDVCSAFISVMEKISIPEIPPTTIFWKEIAALPPQEILSIMKNLSEMHDSFFKCSFSLDAPKDYDPKSMAAIYKALAFQDGLIHLAGAENLGIKGLERPPDFYYLGHILGRFPSNSLINKARPYYFPLRDPKTKEELSALHDYFTERSKNLGASQPLLFQYHDREDRDLKLTEGSAAGSILSPTIPPELSYIRELLKDKEFASRMRNQILNFDSLPLNEKIARVYALEASGTLPEPFLNYRRQISQVQLFWTSISEFRKTQSHDPDTNLAISHDVNAAKDFYTNEWTATIRTKLGSKFLDLSQTHTPRHLFPDRFAADISYLAAKKTQLHNFFIDHKDYFQSSLLEIAQLAATPEVQITETLAFLIKNPEILKTDKRAFIEQILFEGTLLLNEIKQNPECWSKLTEFVQKTYSSYREQGEIDVCCYLLNLANNLHQYKSYLSQKEPELSEILNRSYPLLDPLIELNNLQQDKSLTIEEQSLIHSHLIAFSSELEKIDENTTRKVILGLTYLSKHPLPLKKQNPAIKRGIKKTQQRLMEILPHLSNKATNEILNSILNSQFSIDGQYNWKLDVFPYYSCRKDDKIIKVNILEGQFFLNDEHSTKLPQYILETGYNSYWDFFDEEYPCRTLDLNIFELIDTAGNINILKYNPAHKELTVSKIIDGHPYSKIWSSDFPFITNLDFYQSSKEPYLAYLCDKKGKKHYCVHYEKVDSRIKAVKIENLLHHPPLILVDIFSDNQNYNFLKNFELSTRSIRVWEDNSKKLQRIDLPNFNLSFIPVLDPIKKSWQWQCQEIKGFFISKKQFAEPFAKLDFTSFLKLENAKGEIKFLVPKQKLAEGSNAITGLRKFEIPAGEKPFLIYDFNKSSGRFERELKMGPEETLYLAMIALSAGSDEGYRFARHLLDPNKLRIGQVRDKELEILKWIIELQKKNGDSDPRAIALSLHCFYLLFKEMERSDHHPFTLDRNFFIEISKLLADYASTLQHSQGYHLPLHELKKICQLTMDHVDMPSDVTHLLQTAALDESSNLTFAITKSSIDYVHRETSKKIDSYLNAICKELNEQQKNFAKKRIVTEEIMLCTNSTADFFLKNLPIVFRGTIEQKQELRDTLTLQKAHVSHYSSYYTLMLETILDHPEKFKFLNYPAITWTPEILIPVAELTRKKYAQSSTHLMKPISAGSSTPTLRPQKLPEAIKHTSKIPELLFGDPLQTRLEAVEPFDASKYLIKAPAVDKTKKEQKLNIVHQEIKTLLEMPAGKIGKKVIERIEEGCTIYLNKQTSNNDKTAYKFNLDKLDELENDLQNQISFKLGSLQQEAVRLCVLADQSISNENPKLHALHKIGATKETLTIDDLCLLYAQGTLKDICGEKVVSGIQFYLEAATYAQKLERSLQRVEDLQKNLHTQDLESAEIALVAEMTKERVIDPVKHPACLVLEYYSNILMHAGQYENMKIFLETGKNYQPIRHMIMGSGKTTVLMRLLALLRADGERLSILVLTDDLLESMSEEVRSGSVETFNQFMLPFDIDRSTKLTVATLKEMKDNLERCRKNQGVLILSPKSIHCFYLTFLETCFKSHLMADGPEKINTLERVGLQREILTLLGTHGSALLDEADILLNCRKEVNFPFGKEMSMPEEEQNLLLDLYEVLIENPQVVSILKCDFSPTSVDDKAPLYMKKNYKEKVKPAIVDAMLNKLNLGLHPPEEIALITTYLLQYGNTEQNKTAENFITKLDNHKLRNMLALLKEELNSLLPMSLEKNCGEHYGYSQIHKLAFAIPATNGKPVEGSRFSNAHETGNYTMQTSMKYGVRENIIFEKLDSLTILCLEEMKKNVAYKDTTAFKEFLLLLGDSEDFHLLKLNQNEKKKIANKINTDYHLQRHFLKAYVLPSIHFHKRKLNSNAHMLARFFNTVLGFSGTLWNADTYPNMLSPQPEHDVDAMSLFILAGHLIHIDSEGNIIKSNNVLSIDKITSDSVLEVTENELKTGTNVLAIADCGGYLNEDNPDQLADKATKILHGIRPSIKGTAYFDQDANFLIKEHDRSAAEPVSGSTVTKEERLTIYAQRFTTGTDVRQAPNAVALVTIGRKTLLRDLFQTIWRMRELDRGQRIKFIVGRDIEQVIRQKLNIGDEEMFSQDHLLRFCLINQIEQLSDDIVVAAKQKMLNIIQWEVLKVVMDPTISPSDISDLFVSEMKDLFAPKQANTAFELYGKSADLQDTPVVLEQEKKYYLSLLTQLQNKASLFKKKIDFKALETQLDNLIAKELLPEKALSPMGEKDKQVMVQQKSQVKQQQQVQQVEVNLKEQDQTKWKFMPWPDATSDKIFDPNFYNAPGWGKGYLAAKGLADSTTKTISKNIPEGISRNLPPKSYALGAAAVYMSSQISPTLTALVGLGVGLPFGGLIAASRFSSTAALSLTQISNDYSTMVQLGEKWLTENILDKLPSLNALAEGAPLPYPLSDFLKQDSSLEALGKAIDQALTITDNFASRKAYYSGMKVIKPFHQKSKKIQELLLIQNKKDHSWKVVIIDKEEAKYFRNQLLEDQKKGIKANHALRICLYNPTIGVIQKGAEGITDEEIQKDKNALRLIVQAKFFNGEAFYTKTEREVLKAWIDANDPVKLKEIFRKKILSNHLNSTQIWDRMKDLFPV